MSNTNDLQAIADDMLTRALKIAADQLEIEKGKDLMRAATDKAGEPLTFTSALGVVSTKRGSKGGEVKGSQLVFDAEKFSTLQEATKRLLIDLGVVRSEDIISGARKASVEVKPSTIAKSENDNAEKTVAA